MVHPAPLKSKAPHPNRVSILKSGSWPGDAAKVIDLKNTIYSIYGFGNHEPLNINDPIERVNIVLPI